VRRDIRYGPMQRCLLDVYSPTDSAAATAGPLAAGRLPVVLFLHGGVWASGEKWHYAPLASRLVQEGFVVVVPTYSLYPKALVPQMVRPPPESPALYRQYITLL